MVKARAANRIESVYNHWEKLSQEEFDASLQDFEEFCRHSIILDKNGSPVTFTLNNAQRVVAKEILKALNPIMKKVPCPSIKVLIHKSRQMGITTLFLKLEQYFMTKTKNLNALHVMPTEEECDELKDRKLIPLLQGTHPALMADMTSTANYVDFNEFGGVILDNRLRYMPSGTRGSGHGRTIHLLIEDEYAKYVDPFTLESGILPAMSGNTARIVLFTAKGMNHAYDLSKEAQRSDNSWVYIFLPWYIMDEYETEPYGRFVSLEGLTDYDYFLFSEFKKAGIPPEKWARKAAWYDFVYREDAKRDTKYMYENYPTVAEESFRASGSPIFDAIRINDWRKRTFKTLDIYGTQGETEFRYVEGGAFREYEAPIRGHSYIVGVDPADGEIDGDDSALCVLDVGEKIKCVFAYNGTISQNDFAELITDVATRYNEALVVPERNTGQLMIKWLTEVCHYSNIYTDASKVSGFNDLGVYTSVPVKNEMIARLKFLINNGFYEDFDPVFCQQANYFTYEKTPSGMYRAAASPGHHDDSVMCRMVAMMALDMGRFEGYNQTITKTGRKY
jgi:hypothetical protein|nr:MAG TPA: Terminase large subunit [Caudoviricetes sp.]DAM75729.1 MAG TPA: Terminase large subunit [Caudoviricetes sp.]